jgi:polyisoprenoid-binding protein YceI
MKTSYVVLLLSLAYANVLNATDWTISNQDSKLSFVSVKKHHVAEVHHFKQITGDLADTGAFNLEINLASVETGIDVRNERMQTMLFNTGSIPSAKLSAQLDMSQLTLLDKAQTQPLTVDAELSLNGITQKLSMDVLVTKLADARLLVVSAQPVIIKADEFALAKGVEALREVAGLPMISYAVPVSFYLTLNAKN